MTADSQGVVTHIICPVLPPTTAIKSDFDPIYYGNKQKGCGLSYTVPFTIRDQQIRKLTCLLETFKLVYADKSSNQAPI